MLSVLAIGVLLASCPSPDTDASPINQGQIFKDIVPPEAFDLSVQTIGTYRARLFNKLNLHTNLDIIRFAYRHKLVC
jgi:hypothetical protein